MDLSDVIEKTSKQKMLIEAFELVLRKIDKLKLNGIDVKIVPSRSRDIESTLKKFTGYDNLPSYMWYHITFYNLDSTQTYEIYTAANELSEYGIAFDTGGCSGERDWDLDWSFDVSKERSHEWSVYRDVVEDLISKC